MVWRHQMLQCLIETQASGGMHSGACRISDQEPANLLKTARCPSFRGLPPTPYNKTWRPPDTTVRNQELALRNARHHHPHRLDQKPCIAPAYRASQAEFFLTVQRWKTATRTKVTKRNTAQRMWHLYLCRGADRLVVAAGVTQSA